MKKQFKSVLTVFLVLLMLLSVPVFTSAAEIPEGAQQGEVMLYYAGTGKGNDYAEALGLTDAQITEIKGLMVMELSAKTGTLDLKDYSIDSGCFHYLVDLLLSLENGIAVESVKYYYYEIGVVGGLVLEYYTDEQITELRAAAAVLLDGLKESTLDDLEKTIVLHDRLALWCEYDYQNLLDGHVPDDSYNLYGALVNRICVCDGYSKAFSYLMNRLGIPTRRITSDLDCHAWNAVVINGKEYHIDVTHDDPVWDTIGFVQRSHFLVSTATLSSICNLHDENDYDRTPSDTTYESSVWPWAGSNQSAFVFLNGSVYYLNNDESAPALYRWNGGTDTTKLLDLGSMLWRVSATGYYPGNFSRLATDGEALYYSGPKSVYRYVPGDTEAETVYSLDPSTYMVSDNIYGFRIRDGLLEMCVSSTPNMTGSEPVLTYNDTAKFDTASATLNGDIDMNFYMTLRGPAKTEDAYMEFEVAGKTKTVKLSDVTPEADGRYRFTCKVTAIEMADTITATYYYGDGNEKSVSKDYSVKEYIEAVAENAARGDAACLKALDLVKALADYGYYAQLALSETNGWTIGTDHAEMIRYNTAPDTSLLPDSYCAVENGSAEGVEKITKTLRLQSETALVLYVYTDGETALTSSDIAVTKNGVTCSDYGFAAVSEGKYSVTIPGIAANELADEFTVTVKGTRSITLSALSYAESVLRGTTQSDAVKDAVAALYAYYQAAAAYLA